MEMSARKCRAEEARYLDQSLNDPLPNRRKIAATAAEAWRAEAERAEKRESRKHSPLSSEDAEFTRQFAQEAAEAASLNMPAIR